MVVPRKRCLWKDSVKPEQNFSTLFAVGKQRILLVKYICMCVIMGIRHGSVVERGSPELHTYLVRVRTSARTEYIFVWMMH